MLEPSDRVPFRLTICGLDELPGQTGRGITHAVSIVDPGFPDPRLDTVWNLSAAALFRFDDVISAIPGAEAPTSAHVDEIIALARSWDPAHIGHLLVHCHAGISRSTATAAILLSVWYPELVETVFDHIRAVRPRSWPNSRMVRMGDAALGLNGALISSMARHHQFVAADYPDFAAILRAGARAHEVPDLPQS